MKLILSSCIVLASSPALAQTEIRVEVALCDADTQGVVPPTNRRQCQASMPETNLYWGAMYGVKNFLPRALSATRMPVPLSAEEKNRGAIERFSLQSRIGKMPVAITATAWSDIKQAIAAALKPASGQLVIFVGHNGLMDFSAEQIPHAFTPFVAAHLSVLACKSAGDFMPILKGLGHTPYVMTRSLMAPEAYVVEAVIRSFIAGKNPHQGAREAGLAYSKFQKLRQAAGRSVFWPSEKAVVTITPTKRSP